MEITLPEGKILSFNEPITRTDTHEILVRTRKRPDAILPNCVLPICHTRSGIYVLKGSLTS
jgi:hypothetical protein